MRSNFPSTLFCNVLIGFLWLVSHSEAQSLKYAWTTGQKFSFEFDITVDGDQQTITYKGITNYTVDSASDQQLR